MFFKKAKEEARESWKYIVGSILIFVGWQTVAMLPILGLFVYITSQGGRVGMNFTQAALDVGVSKNITFALLLLTFLLACVCIYLVVKFLHKRAFLSIITSRASFSWKRASFGFFVWFSMALFLFLISYQQTPEEYVYSFDPTKFFPLLLICIVLLPFQTSFEELFLRGYAMQGVTAITGSRFLALLLPAVIFGLLHSANPEVFKYGFWIMMPFYIGMGLFLGIMAIMDDGIEMPLGVHFANNLTGALLVGMEDSALKTDALFVVKSYNPMEGMPYLFAAMFLFLFFAALVFGWRNFGKLVGKV